MFPIFPVFLYHLCIINSTQNMLEMFVLSYVNSDIIHHIGVYYQLHLTIM